MHKDFDKWNEKKKKIHSNTKRVTFKERDVLWCHLGVNVGDEEDGKGEGKLRPVLILKKLSAKLCVIVPLSTQLKDEHYYHQFEFKGKTQSVMLSQIKLIDSKRLTHILGTVPDNDF